MRAEDLIGKQIGLWHVDAMGPRMNKNNIQSLMCTCRCGTHRAVQFYSLKSGKSLCCGCIKSHEDLSGQVFGRLTVLYEADRKMCGNRKKIRFHCVCECGNELDVFAEQLKSGNTRSCGCLQKDCASEIKSLKFQKGDRFGRLTIDYRIGSNKNKHAMWHCICDCGNTIDVDAAALKSGNTQSCGCYRRDLFMKNLVGNTYGLLKVICYAGQFHGGGALWLCQCECGNYMKARGSNLVQGGVVSCGCRKLSKLELYVQQYLIRHGYIMNESFFRQVHFDDLRGFNDGLLTYDFAIYVDNKLVQLIECQGRQHYEVVWHGEDGLAQQQLHDELKYDYAKRLGVDLLCILYKDCKVYDDVAKILDDKLLGHDVIIKAFDYKD